MRIDVYMYIVSSILRQLVYVFMFTAWTIILLFNVTGYTKEISAEFNWRSFGYGLEKFISDLVHGYLRDENFFSH